MIFLFLCSVFTVGCYFKSMVLNNLDSFTCIHIFRGPNHGPIYVERYWHPGHTLLPLQVKYTVQLFSLLPPYPCKKRIFTSGYYHPTVLLESLIDWYFLLRISLQICIKNVLFCGSVGTIVWQKSSGQTFINRFHKFSPFSAWSPHLLKRKENQLRHIQLPNGATPH